MLYSFLVLTKCQVLNLRVGRSRDQVLQRAQSNLKNEKMYIKKQQSAEVEIEIRNRRRERKETVGEKESKIINK